MSESDDEPGVSRIRASYEEAPDGPGLALSRAFGDFFVKDFGLISEPDVIQRTITTRDRFVILASDGVCAIPSHYFFSFSVSSTGLKTTLRASLLVRVSLGSPELSWGGAHGHGQIQFNKDGGWPHYNKKKNVFYV